MESSSSAAVASTAQLPTDSPQLKLARALFDLGPNDTSVLAFSPGPYIEYIQAHDPSRPEYIEFFVEVLEHFKRNSVAGRVVGAGVDPASIQECIESLFEKPNNKYLCEQLRDKDVIKDNVLLVLGVWTLMQKYYLPLRNNNRRILQAYCKRTNNDYDEKLGLQVTFPTLVSECGLLPHEAENQYDESSKKTSSPNAPNNSVTPPAFGLHESLDFESLTIKASALNAFKLTNFAGVRIRWTNNISRHLLLSKHAQKHYLELFLLPCALQDGSKSALRDIKAFEGVATEILCSYSTLFSPKKPSFLHKYLGVFVGLRFWCWCLCCSSYRLRYRELKKLKDNSTSTTPYDDALRSLMSERPAGWKIDANVWRQNDFKHLWPRILALDSYLQGAKPWNFWVIFRDRRDTVQFWTFFFGTVILVLTFVQVCLGIAQVAGAFK